MSLQVAVRFTSRRDQPHERALIPRPSSYCVGNVPDDRHRAHQPAELDRSYNAPAAVDRDDQDHAQPYSIRPERVAAPHQHRRRGVHAARDFADEGRRAALCEGCSRKRGRLEAFEKLSATSPSARRSAPYARRRPDSVSATHVVV